MERPPAFAPSTIDPSPNNIKKSIITSLPALPGPDFIAGEAPSTSGTIRRKRGRPRKATTNTLDVLDLGTPLVASNTSTQRNKNHERDSRAQTHSASDTNVDNHRGPLGHGVNANNVFPAERKRKETPDSVDLDADETDAERLRRQERAEGKRPRQRSNSVEILDADPNFGTHQQHVAGIPVQNFELPVLNSTSKITQNISIPRHLQGGEYVNAQSRTVDMQTLPISIADKGDVELMSIDDESDSDVEITGVNVVRRAGPQIVYRIVTVPKFIDLCDEVKKSSTILNMRQLRSLSQKPCMQHQLMIGLNPALSLLGVTQI
ncbi:hypothetical protein BJ742DRAFT_30014 [Cladochytrium replicatum]|nr:hypothetical protein BJ742DRAFT_30014 [Cladochytrium replicatum]